MTPFRKDKDLPNLLKLGGPSMVTLKRFLYRGLLCEVTPRNLRENQIPCLYGYIGYVYIAIGIYI